jgi:hypothetical protein
MDVELVHRAAETRFNKWLSVLVGLSALAASVFAALDVHAGRRQEQALNRSSRLSAEIFGRLAGSAPPQALAYQVLQLSNFNTLKGTQRSLSAFEQPGTFAYEFTLAGADRRVGITLLGLAKRLRETPDPSSGLDETARHVIATRIADVDELVAEQNHQLDLADKYGERGTRAVYALSLLALAAVVLGLSAVIGTRGGGITLSLGAVALLAAAGWGGSALFI